MKELLAFDVTWLGLTYDDDDATVEAVSLEELIDNEFEDGAIEQFAEACKLLDEDCIVLDTGDGAHHFLYVGTADSAGEYPVITVSDEDGPLVSGFVPFDVWVAQSLGAIGEGRDAPVPSEYAAHVKELARKNGDGRDSFVPGKATGSAKTSKKN